MKTNIRLCKEGYDGTTDFKKYTQRYTDCKLLKISNLVHGISPVYLVVKLCVVLVIKT